MNTLWKKGAVLLLTVAGILGILSCTPKEAVSQKTVITVLADDSTVNMDLYRTKLAAKFPDIHFEFEFQNNLLPEIEIARRVKHGDVRDLVFSSSLDVNMEGLSDCFMDLSGKSYTSIYQTSYLNSLDVDGHIYYLPADMAIEGIVYYYTLFEEHGLKAPENYEELEALCMQLREMGIRPGMLLTGGNAGSELFEHFYALDKKGSLSSWKWAEKFNAGEATAQEGELETTLDIFDAYAELGLLEAEDFNTSRQEGSWFLVNKSSAMLYGGGSIPYDMVNKGSEDEFRLMPFFHPTDGKGYFFVVPLLNLAVGKHVEEDPEKEEAIDRILEYITSEEGQEDLMNIKHGAISPVFGLKDLKDESFYADVADKITDENLLLLTQFPSCSYTLNSNMGAYLEGKLNQEEVISLLTAAGRHEGDSQQTLAAAAEDFTLDETNALVLKAMKESVKTEVALLRQSVRQRQVSAYTISGKLYCGPVTEDDISCIYPIQEFEEKELPMLQVEMSGKKLLDLIGTDATYYYMGVTVRYEWDRKIKDYRAAGLLDEQGQEIGLEDRVQVAMLAQEPFIKEKYDQWKESEYTLREALMTYLEHHYEIAPCEVNPAVYEK